MSVEIASKTCMGIQKVIGSKPNFSRFFKLGYFYEVDQKWPFKDWTCHTCFHSTKEWASSKCDGRLSPTYFYFIFVVSKFQLVENCSLMSLMGYKQQTSGAGSDRYTNWATTTAIFCNRQSWKGFLQADILHFTSPSGPMLKCERHRTSSHGLAAFRPCWPTFKAFFRRLSNPRFL